VHAEAVCPAQLQAAPWLVSCNRKAWQQQPSTSEQERQ
jgi:hypothetical protein